MHHKLTRALCASTALATGLLLASSALAQSTGTAIVEELIVTGTSGPQSMDGAIVAEREPKSRASITAEFITRQTPGQTPLDSINLLPAVNFTNNDAYGSAGGDIVVRGFDSQRVALLQDGVPLNDSGNYAVFPNQQLDSDLIERVTVNLGTTDVDSPTAAAAGGTINYITRRASDEFGVRAEVALGSEEMRRYYATVETGAIGPWGTKAWFSALYSTYNLFTPHDSPVDPAGKIEKTQFNARVDQDFGEIGQASLIFHYNENRNNFINRISLTRFNMRGVTAANQPDTGFVNATSCVRPTPAAGTAQVDTAAACPTGFYDFNINPSNTGNIRGLSSWNLSDNLTLTVDPSFQYVLANGGGAQTWSERDAQIRGNTTAVGVDLNGDGDTLDTVYLYRPNTTNTRRYGVTSSLIWKFADNQSVRVAYTFDKAKHRQTGDVGFIDQNGHVENVFGGKDGEGRRVDLPDGTNLRRRDRASVALLNQFAVEYRGRFFDDKLLLNAGLRAPFFKRELNQFCYQRDTFNAYCTTQTGTPVAGTNDGTGRPLVTFPVSALNPSAANRYGQPRAFERKYDKVLPNLGASYEVNDDLTVFASYAETLSAPRTDDLYDQILVDPGPESAKAMDLGVRFQRSNLMAAGAVWRNSFTNRIERVFDEQAGIAFSENVGDVDLWGIDGQVGFEPTEDLSFYASLSYIESEIKDNIPNPSGVGVIATKGKTLYEVPKVQGGVRARWDVTEAVSLGVQGKFVGDRWTNLVNTEKFPGYSLWDLDARVRLDRLGFGYDNTYVQLNVRNLFDERYLGDITTNLTGTALGQPGYRRAFIVTLHAEF
jgi:iron complex outermembrane recepter protein